MQYGTYFYFTIDLQILIHALKLENNSGMLFIIIMFTVKCYISGVYSEELNKDSSKINLHLSL